MWYEENLLFKDPGNHLFSKMQKNPKNHNDTHNLLHLSILQRLSSHYLTMSQPKKGKYKMLMVDGENHVLGFYCLHIKHVP